MEPIVSGSLFALSARSIRSKSSSSYSFMISRRVAFLFVVIPSVATSLMPTRHTPAASFQVEVRPQQETASKTRYCLGLSFPTQKRLVNDFETCLTHQIWVFIDELKSKYVQLKSIISHYLYIPSLTCYGYHTNTAKVSVWRVFVNLLRFPPFLRRGSDHKQRQYRQLSLPVCPETA